VQDETGHPIRSGTVVDGTGAPGRRADPRTRGDRTTEIGPDPEARNREKVDDIPDGHGGTTWRWSRRPAPAAGR